MATVCYSFFSFFRLSQLEQRAADLKNEVGVRNENLSNVALDFAENFAAAKEELEKELKRCVDINDQLEVRLMSIMAPVHLSNSTFHFLPAKIT
jgi:hypothetical protein